MGWLVYVRWLAGGLAGELASGLASWLTTWLTGWLPGWPGCLTGLLAVGLPDRLNGCDQQLENNWGSQVGKWWGGSCDS
jgi:hypothetical protein